MRSSFRDVVKDLYYNSIYAAVEAYVEDYNYWRNLYGGKIFALIIYLLIGMREVILNKSFNIIGLFEKPYPEYIAFLLMLCSIIVICLLVNKNTVRRKAFDYAKTLVEVCETIE